jgi:hypothetical protein
MNRKSTKLLAGTLFLSSALCGQQTNSQPQQPEPSVAQPAANAAAGEDSPVVIDLAKQLEAHPNAFMSSPLFKKLAPDLQAAVVARAFKDNAKAATAKLPQAQTKQQAQLQSSCSPAANSKKKHSRFGKWIHDQAQNVVNQQTNKLSAQAAQKSKGNVGGIPAPIIPDGGNKNVGCAKQG